MGPMIEGMTAESVAHAKAQPNITIKNPNRTPKLKGSARTKPCFMPLPQLMMLFGPGVIAVMKA